MFDEAKTKLFLHFRWSHEKSLTTYVQYPIVQLLHSGKECLVFNMPQGSFFLIIPPSTVENFPYPLKKLEHPVFQIPYLCPLGAVEIGAAVMALRI